MIKKISLIFLFLKKFFFDENKYQKLKEMDRFEDSYYLRTGDISKYEIGGFLKLFSNSMNFSCNNPEVKLPGLQLSTLSDHYFQSQQFDFYIVLS